MQYALKVKYYNNGRYNKAYGIFSLNQQGYPEEQIYSNSNFNPERSVSKLAEGIANHYRFGLEHDKKYDSSIFGRPSDYDTNLNISFRLPSDFPTFSRGMSLGFGGSKSKFNDILYQFQELNWLEKRIFTRTVLNALSGK